jgi:hypothetical protein
VQKDIAKNILHHIPVQYMTMRVSQQTVLLHEKVLPLIMTSTSTFRRQRRAEITSYLTKYTLLLYYIDQPVNTVHGNIQCLMSETSGIQQQTALTKWRVILLQQLSCCINYTAAATVICKGLIQLHFIFKA